MPDPLSITFGVTSLVTSSIAILKTYLALCAGYMPNDESIMGVKAQFEQIQTTLGNIQEVLLSRPQHAAQWGSDEHLCGRNFQSTMAACELTFASISEKLQVLLNESIDKRGHVISKTTLADLWGASNISIPLTHVSSYLPALSFLLTALMA